MSVSALPITAVDRPARYFERLDAALPRCASDDARLIFLKTELEKWETRYLAWQDMVRFDEWLPDGSPVDTNEPSANDYVLVITGLGSRIAAIEARA